MKLPYDRFLSALALIALGCGLACRAPEEGGEATPVTETGSPASKPAAAKVRASHTGKAFIVMGIQAASLQTAI